MITELHVCPTDIADKRAVPKAALKQLLVKMLLLLSFICWFRPLALSSGFA